VHARPTAVAISVQRRSVLSAGLLAGVLPSHSSTAVALGSEQEAANDDEVCLLATSYPTVIRHVAERLTPCPS
jgi:hypothetical protein